MISCAANGCPSTQTTRIDGKPISFFAFPEDDLRKNQWLHNCNLASGVVSDREPLYLCELHFEGFNFTASRDLKPNAVPTLFGRIERAPKKHKAESILEIIPMQVSPLKQKKPDDQLHTLVIPQRNSFIQLTDNIEITPDNSKANVSIDNGITMNGSVTSSGSILHGNYETNAKVYRLTIQIDKIRGRPGPRCKKPLVPLVTLNDIMKDLLRTNEPETVEKMQTLQGSVKKACTKGGCKLKRCMYDSKSAFQCELCDKYYIVKREDSQENKDNSCSLCSLTFPSLQLLYAHIRKHFICDMCQTECSSQLTYDKHVRLHVSTDPSYPYKCHLCTKVFELKEGVKQHCLIEHPKIKLQNTVLQVTSPSAKVSQQNDYRCVSCNITFRNEQAFRNHMNSHKKKEGLRCNISDTNNVFPVPNPLTGSQIGILQPVKFSCNVCFKEFDNVGEVDIHTRTHLEDVEEAHKCNICKKSFKSSTLFSEHLKHHLSRAHPCPICSKAFINRTTLKIHLKTHSESKLSCEIKCSSKHYKLSYN